jgi:hypothetical protein
MARGRTSVKVPAEPSAPATSAKDEAVAAGRDAAKADGVEHIIKNQDGQIGEKESHGNHPPNIPG